jgi:hypothetical protein
MHHRGRGLQREPDDLMRSRSAEIRDEADAARIVLFSVGGVLERRRRDVRDGGDLASDGWDEK